MAAPAKSSPIKTGSGTGRTRAQSAGTGVKARAAQTPPVPPVDPTEKIAAAVAAATKHGPAKPLYAAVGATGRKPPKGPEIVPAPTLPILVAASMPARAEPAHDAGGLSDLETSTAVTTSLVEATHGPDAPDRFAGTASSVPASPSEPPAVETAPDTSDERDHGGRDHDESVQVAIGDDAPRPDPLIEPATRHDPARTSDAMPSVDTDTPAVSHRETRDGTAPANVSFAEIVRSPAIAPVTNEPEIDRDPAEAQPSRASRPEIEAPREFEPRRDAEAVPVPVLPSDPSRGSATTPMIARAALSSFEEWQALVLDSYREMMDARLAFWSALASGSDPSTAWQQQIDHAQRALSSTMDRWARFIDLTSRMAGEPYGAWPKLPPPGA